MTTPDLISTRNLDTQIITMNISQYLYYRRQVSELGFAHEIEWAETIQPVSDPMVFWCEFSWVVLNSGMKNAIARIIWEKVKPAVLSGHSASSVFGHKGKAKAIDYVYQHRERLLSEYLNSDDKMSFLRALPWIGTITCWHLAKNYGHDVAKPDRHLVRIAGDEGVHALCKRLSDESGDRIATVDYVIWRAANQGLL